MSISTTSRTCSFSSAASTSRHRTASARGCATRSSGGGSSDAPSSLRVRQKRLLRPCPMWPNRSSRPWPLPSPRPGPSRKRSRSRCRCPCPCRNPAPTTTQQTGSSGAASAGGGGTRSKPGSKRCSPTSTGAAQSCSRASPTCVGSSRSCISTENGCYAEPTDGAVPSREIRFSFLLRVFRGRQISNPNRRSRMNQQSFRGLGVRAEVSDALERRGFTTPFAIQSLVIGDALRGQDLLARSPTGSGKTLAFAIPIVERLQAADARPSALVLVPTRELAVQVAEEFEAVASARGLSVAAVYGGIPVRSQWNQAKDAHVLVATPGRLKDLVDRKLVRLDAIKILILDEADRMLDMGFLPQVDAIVEHLPRKRQ